jgi:hypothetical protein
LRLSSLSLLSRKRPRGPMINSTHIYPALPDALLTKPAPQGPRVWAASVLLVAGLTLVGMGGCFLIGVLSVLRPELFIAGRCPDQVVLKPVSLSNEEVPLVCTLYGLAFLSYLGAIVLLVLGVRGLWRILSTENAAAEGQRGHGP